MCHFYFKSNMNNFISSKSSFILINSFIICHNLNWPKYRMDTRQYATKTIFKGANSLLKLPTSILLVLTFHRRVNDDKRGRKLLESYIN